MMFEHHAYLYQVETEDDKQSELIKNFPAEEVVLIEQINFGINDARELIRVAFTKPVVSEFKLMVVSFKTITVEAQQALLKILEEPPATSKFLFIIPKGCSILPTLKSRFQDYDFISSGLRSNDAEDDLNLFLKLDYKDRLSVITKNTDKSDSVWINNIKQSLSKKLESELAVLEQEKISVLNFVITNLNTRGASNKMLLEEMALILPISKKSVKI